MLGLRTSTGFPMTELEQGSEAIDRLVEKDLARVADGNLVLTDRGFLVLDEIVCRLSTK
jgi:hypothetical protein